jgi:NADH dehydrogenase/NADH:ubiquinone oxidoreductase subunit G
VQGGGKLVVLGDRNGLWRSTAHWLRGDPLALVDSLLSALQDGVKKNTAPEIAAAVATLGGQAPAALLAHPSLTAIGRARLEVLAKALGANGEGGMVGAPLLGANGRGAAELAPDLVRADTGRVLASSTLLAIGDEPWADMPSGSFARLIVATSQAVADDSRIEVVFPMAHAYERQGTITNLEGRVQHQAGGASPSPHARSDWGIVAGLIQHLGVPGPAPDNIEVLRSFIADEHPSMADALRQEPLIARV